MANLIIQENGAERTAPAIHGEEITIQTPCDCSAVTGVQIAGVVYPFYDAAGKVLPTGTGLFAKDSLIRVLIDTENKRATIINHAITPASIGAVSKAGDTMTGTLALKDITGGNREARVFEYDGTTYLRNYLSDSDFADIYIRPDGIRFTGKNNGTIFDYEVLHEGNKPTAADVGAPDLVDGRIDGAQACSNVRTINASTTLSASDIGKTIVFYGDSDITVTLPANLAFGTEFEIVRFGPGTVTITPASGVTMNNATTSRKIKNQYGAISLKRIYSISDTWLIVGDLE